MKLLLVDDELGSLHRLKGALANEDPFLKVTLLTNAREALERLGRDPHDVLITHMSMPGMNGLTLLERVKQLYPAVIRIIVDGSHDHSTRFRLMNVAHQVVSKPLDGQLLWAIISQTAGVLPLIGDEIMRGIVGTASQLPPAPRIYRELSQLLQEPNCSIDDVVKMIGRDPVMAARLLQLANSAFFAQRGQSLELRSAVVRLGFNTICNLMLTVELFEPSGEVARICGRELEIAQQYSFRVAQFAEQLARGTPLLGDAFVAGLLADIGQIVLLLTQGNEWRDCRAEAKRYDRPLQDMEREHFGISHCEVGGYLLGIWGLPYSLVEAVTNHHYPERIHAPIYSLSAIAAISAALVEGTPISESWLVSIKAKTRVELVREKAPQS